MTARLNEHELRKFAAFWLAVGVILGILIGVAATSWMLTYDVQIVVQGSEEG